MSITSRAEALQTIDDLKSFLTENAIALRLGVRRSSVSDWRRPGGRTAPSPSRWADIDLLVDEINDLIFPPEPKPPREEPTFVGDLWVVRVHGPQQRNVSDFGEVEAATEEEALKLASELFGGFIDLDGGSRVMVERA